MNPAPPPPDAGPAPASSGYFFADPAFCRTATMAAVLNEMLAALPLLTADPAAGAAHVRQVLRNAGLSWPQVLTHRVNGYRDLLVRYGHKPPPSPTAPGRCGPLPPNGRQENGELCEAWIGLCAQAVSERVAWVPVPMLAEMALLVAMEPPMRWQVERADTIMRQVWAEPSAAGLGPVQLVAYEPWHADAITPALCAIYGEKPGQPGSIVHVLRSAVDQSSLVRTVLDGCAPVAIMGCVVGREAGAPWLFRTERAFGRPLALARCVKGFLADCHGLHRLLRVLMTTGQQDRQLTMLGFVPAGDVPGLPDTVRWERRR